jgi:hypothetical protein
MLDLRRNGDFQELKIEQERKAIEADFYTGHIGAFLRNQLGLNVLEAIAWDELITRKNAIPKIQRVGKILIGNPADTSQKILSEYKLNQAQIEIYLASNSSGGIVKDRKNPDNGQYQFTVKNKPSLNQNLQFNSYQSISDAIEEKYSTEKLKTIGELITDYVVLEGIDPATQNPFYIEIGNPPFSKKPTSSRIFPKIGFKDRITQLI